MTLRDVMVSWLSDPDPVKRSHARNRLAILDGTADPPEPAPPPRFTPPARYAGPMPACLYASPALAGSCNPVRCWAHRGTPCGGSHATPEHCAACLRGRP